MISDKKHLPGLGLNDHICLQFALTCYGKFIHDNKCRYNIHQADFYRMQTLLEVHFAGDWDYILSSLDINQAWDVFASHYESILKECIPYQVSKKSIYMTREAFHMKKKLSCGNSISYLVQRLTFLYMAKPEMICTV